MVYQSALMQTIGSQLIWEWTDVSLEGFSDIGLEMQKR
jgi:hypothetical protein